MITIPQLLSSGATRAVRGFAIEAVRGVKDIAVKPSKSALSRAVKRLRQEFDIPKTRAGYEVARQVFRESIKEVKRAEMETERQWNLRVQGLDPSKYVWEHKDVGKLARYTVYVELASNRSPRTYRGQVVVQALFGMDEKLIAEKARQLVMNRDVDSLSVKGSRNYGMVPLQSWQIARYEVNAIEINEPGIR